MGLQVWLPLNGTLENKGLSNVTVTNNGTTFDTGGKIGSCYYNTTEENCVALTGYMNKLKTYTTYSMCAWIYMTARPSGHSSTILSSGDWNRSNGNLCFALYNYSSGYTKLLIPNTGGWSTGINLSTKLQLETWYHIAITYDGTKTVGYVNGNYIGEYAGGGICTNSNSDNLNIGKATYTNGFTLMGKINDVRIYDNCLSVKEIKEIYQGLILHYGLDIEPKNLVPFSLTTENYTQNNYQSRTSSTISDFVYHVDGLQSETSLDTSYSILSTNYVTLPSNTTVYLSFHCKGKNTVDFYFGTSGNSAKTRLIDSSNNTYFPQQQVNIGSVCDCWVTLPITTGSDTQYNIQIGMDNPNIYGIGSYIEYKDIMVSTDIPRNYVPYTETNVVYDCSGYGLNGTPTAELVLNTDTPRYHTSTEFNGSKYIQVTSPSTEVRTVSFWAKWNSIPSGQSVVFVDYKSKIGFGLMSTGILCSSNGVSTYTFPKTSIVANQWYHFAIVNTSSTPTATTRDLYINGVKQTPTSSTSNWTYALDYLQIGKRSTTSDGFAGNLSDFRMYVTALSAESIMDLYNAPEYIDNSGTIGAFEFVENSTDGQEIGKNGVVSVKNLIEPSDNLKLMPDGSVFLKLLRHNNPASKLFTEDNCWLNSSDPDLYSSLIQLKNVDWMKNLETYEFLSCEKLTSSSTESQVRWSQTSNPALTSTATGYELISGSPRASAALMNKGTYGAMHNGSSWCCCGSYTAYQGGIPGFTNVVTTGYLELYIRIPDEILKGYVDGGTKFFKQSIVSGKLKEI